MEINWTDFKSLITSGQIKVKYLELANKYHIYGIDDRFSVSCTVYKSSEDGTDFETNFKPTIINKLQPETSPFASKTIPGYKLYRRVHGQTATLAAEGDTTVDFTVPYSLCKIDEVQMRWLPEGVTGDFIVVHPIAGPVSQHAFGVPLTAGSHTDKSSYDATLQAGLILRMVFHNPTQTSKIIGIAWVLHEMVAT